MTLAAIVASASCLAACGGGDDSSSSTSDTATAPSASAEETSSGEASSGESDSAEPSEEGESAGGGSSSGNGNGSSEGGSSPGHHSSDLPYRGEVSSQSAEFQQYSHKGKLHLAEFGEEASGSDHGEAEEVLVNYLQAAGQEEWDKACTYLSPVTKAQIEELAKSAEKGATSGCAEALAWFAESPLWKEANGSPIYASEGIASFRIKEGGLARGGAGFALFHGSDGKDHWIAMKVEGGGWKILSTSPQPFL